MELSWDIIVDLVGPGPLAAILFIGWKGLGIWKKDVEARLKDNEHRKYDNQLKKETLRFLKEQGHDVQIPQKED